MPAIISTHHGSVKTRSQARSGTGQLWSTGRWKKGLLVWSSLVQAQPGSAKYICSVRWDPIDDIALYFSWNSDVNTVNWIEYGPHVIKFDNTNSAQADPNKTFWTPFKAPSYTTKAESTVTLRVSIADIQQSAPTPEDGSTLSATIREIYLFRV